MKKKIVILITGQKKRLELSSKIKNIIIPLSTKYNIVVVLSLSESNNFTNKYKYKKDFKYNLCEIEKELDTIKYYINNVVYPEFTLNDTLVSMLDKKNRGKEFIKKRAMNHVRQYYTLYNSWSIVKKINPDILIRIRDDATLSTPLTLTEFNKSIYSKKCIITPIEENWGGINDKLAIVFKDAIESYLNKPLELYNSTKNFKKIINNPEQFLKYVYSISKLSLYTFDIKVNILGQ